jgi:hypothetical protein
MRMRQWVSNLVKIPHEGRGGREVEVSANRCEWLVDFDSEENWVGVEFAAAGRNGKPEICEDLGLQNELASASSAVGFLIQTSAGSGGG